MTSFQEQPLSLYQEEIASNHNTNQKLSNIAIPNPISLSFLDSLGSLSAGLYRLISNPLVRGDSNISVQSDEEGAHFVPYGRGHAEIANQYDEEYNEAYAFAPIQNIKSKVIQNEAATDLELDIDRECIETGSLSQILSDLNLSEPEPEPTEFEVAPYHYNDSMAIYEENSPMMEIMKEKCCNLLKEWNLTKYCKVLIDEMGYDDIEDWKSIKMEELTEEMHFKRGHAKRFITKTKEYFDIIN